MVFVEAQIDANTFVWLATTRNYDGVEAHWRHTGETRHYYSQVLDITETEQACRAWIQMCYPNARLTPRTKRPNRINFQETHNFQAFK